MTWEKNKLLYAIVLLVFGAPLALYVLQMRKEDRTRENRLREISRGLKEKQEDAIKEKKSKIERKYSKSEKD